MHTIARERTNFVELTPTIRRNLEGALQYLVDLLDALDGDADFEPEAGDDDGDEDEPTLGAPEQDEFNLRQAWARGSRHDGEGELTACEFSTFSGGHWSRGSHIPDDAEESHDREADESDVEPSLGAPEWTPEAGDAPWARGASDIDREEADE